MRTHAADLFRLALLAAVLGFAAAQTAEAQRSAPTTRGAVSTASSSRPGRAADPDPVAEEPVGDPVAGILWISGAVVVIIFLAWLAMRVGDPQTPADGVPN